MSNQNKKISREYMHSIIPYIHCYEEGGMIEVAPDIYTKSFEIREPEERAKEEYNSKFVEMVMKRILLNLTKTFSFQFVSYNSPIEKDVYLKQILAESMCNTGEDMYQDLNNCYEQMITENCDIGHNNSSQRTYLVISVKAVIPEEAAELFKIMDSEIKSVFSALYGYELYDMSIERRLKLLYCMYHPDEDEKSFGENVNYDGKGFSIDSMIRMKLQTKDVIAPDVYEENENDYLMIGKNYVRTFFINMIPPVFFESLFQELSSVSSHSIISVSYESTDYELGYQTAAKHVKDNTSVSNILVRDSVSDRKKKKTVRTENSIRDSEEEYFYKECLGMFKSAKAKDEPVMLASFVITLYTTSLEELERETELLLISASRYVCQIRSCEMMQGKGFQSALPLNNMQIRVQRAFQLDQLAQLQPIPLKHLFEQKLSFYGLNAVNDNQIFCDRHRFSAMLIAGAEQTGKSHCIKRCATNDLIGTANDVILITNAPWKYKKFTEKLHGQMYGEFYPDIFLKDSNYNLDSPIGELKQEFLEAHLAMAAQEHGKQRESVYYQLRDQIGEEAKYLCSCCSLMDSLKLAKEQSHALPIYVDSLQNARFDVQEIHKTNRLFVIGYENSVSLIDSFDYAWNYAVKAKKSNCDVSILVDGIDPFLYQPIAMRYLLSVMQLAEKINIPMTFSLQSSVNVVTDKFGSATFDELLNHISYFMLLTMGPVERKRFVEHLNISQQLIPYFAEQGVGEGVLILPNGCVPFNDNFIGEEESSFYDLFQ